jgi:hypothetical protein
MTRIEWLGLLAFALVIVGLVSAAYGGGYAWLAFCCGWAAGCLTVVLRREFAKHKRDLSRERLRGNLRDIER